jgi:hypothetical protein
MAGSIFNLEDSNELELHLNFIPKWMVRVCLPILIMIIIGLPLSLYFVEYREKTEVEVTIFPLVNPVQLGELSKVFNKSTGSLKRIAKGELVGLGTNGDSVLSPIDGLLKVSYESASAGVRVAVVPFNNKYVVRASLPTGYSGSVVTGQQVLLEIPGSVRTAEYLRFTIKDISNYSMDGKIVIDLTPDTNFDNKPSLNLMFPEGKPVLAQILLSEESILAKMFGELTKR